MTEEKKAISVVAVCLVVIATGFFLLRDREPPVVETRERLAELQESIEAWVAAKGSVPESLEAMGLPDEAIQDHAGVIFEYQVSDDGTDVTLISYGADGKPGGHMFRADNEVSFSVEIEKAP